MPISFIVAWSRSRSLLSSSSSNVSSLRAPVTTGLLPARSVKGLRLGFGSGFFSFPPNMLKLFQSNDSERRDRVAVGGFGELVVFGVTGELKVVSPGDAGTLWFDEEKEKMAD